MFKLGEVRASSKESSRGEVLILWEKFEDKISNYKSLLKDIPIGLHILDQDNKKFNLNFRIMALFQK